MAALKKLVREGPFPAGIIYDIFVTTHPPAGLDVVLT